MRVDTGNKTLRNKGVVENITDNELLVQQEKSDRECVQADKAKEAYDSPVVPVKDVLAVYEGFEATLWRK